MSEIEKYGDHKDNVPKMIIGNKADLEADRIVTVEEGEKMAGFLSA